MHDSRALRILVTGGTFDKTYDELAGRLAFAETHVAEMLRLGRSGVDLRVETLMLIDSLEMTDADRAIVLEGARRSPEDALVVTHGTDTMAETARVIGTAQLAKTVVLTGAMRPYEFGSSDGLFNLGSAIAFAQTLPHGTYVAMNGRALPWDNVEKDRASGRFGPRA